MRTSTWIAIGLFAAVAAWLASGLVISGEGEEEEAQAPTGPPQPTLVETRLSSAEEVPQYIYAQGVAEPYRTVDVTSSIGGTVEEVFVQQGDEVEAGAVLAQLRLEALESELQSAETRMERLAEEVEAARELEAEGFTARSRLRELEAQLAEARAALENVRAQIRDTTIEASISGIVSDVFVNSGETVGAGTAIARVVDNAPLRTRLNISQREIERVDVGREAVVSLATGELVAGRVCFVAPAADLETRTFRVEVRVPNEERDIPSVVSAEVRFQTGEALAHFISPAILTLSEDGTLGVKAVDAEHVVHFHPVEVVRTGRDGIWVGGLPEQLQLITTGQGFVREGEEVRVMQEAEGEAAARADGAHLPTATVEERAFNGAEDLPDPPPTEELCRGTAANVVTTSSVPGRPAGSPSPSSPAAVSQPGASSAQPLSPGGQLPQGQGGSAGQEGTGGGAGVPPAPSQPGGDLGEVQPGGGTEGGGPP